MNAQPDGRFGGPPAAALIVCEQRGHWAALLRPLLAVPDRWFSPLASANAQTAQGPPPAVRQAIAPPPLRLVEVRRPADCDLALVAAPQSLIALEWLPERRAEQVALVQRLGREFPLAPVVALAVRPLADEVRLAREAGAIHVVRSPRAVGELVRIARRFAAALPPRPADPLADVWDRLPWSSQTKVVSNV